MMQIVRLDDGSIGFIDKRRLSKAFGFVFLIIGGAPLPAMISTLSGGLEGLNSIAVVLGCSIVMAALFFGFCLVTNWHETWVMTAQKRVLVSGRFGFWRTEKSWEFSEGGVVKPWVKCANYTTSTTTGLTLEAKGDTLELLSGTEIALPRVMQLGPHIAKLLEVPFEDLEPIPEVQIYPAVEDKPENLDPTHFYEELGDKSGGAIVMGFGLVFFGVWLTDPTEIALILMALPVALLTCTAGYHLLKKFSQLKINIEKQTITYRWRTFFKLYTEELPLDALACVLVTYFRSDNRSQSQYQVNLYFGEHSMLLFSMKSVETTCKEVQERAWALAHQFGCPMYVTLNRRLEESEKLVISA